MHMRLIFNNTNINGKYNVRNKIRVEMSLKNANEREN